MTRREWYGLRMTAWQAWKALPLRMKVAVAVAAPLWLPVALATWLEAEDES